ncbi:hypothetical protein SAMN04488130_106146 [Flavobacterium urumqiense]|uniref:Uncharacterized protein n=1 Tax=Flavobacterium urumqiense TaxID=935224 RepID=A0A1H5XPU3_9FLAO|nr:hypothetical protein SAMN04488130_106146 [Flavobacterium urumqiense]
MKNLFILVGLLMCSLGVMAKDLKMNDSKMHSAKVVQMKDHLMMKDGKMMVMKED